MVAWTGIEHYRMGRFDPPPPADEPEDFMVCFNILFTYYDHISFIYPLKKNKKKVAENEILSLIYHSIKECIIASTWYLGLPNKEYSPTFSSVGSFNYIWKVETLDIAGHGYIILVYVHLIFLFCLTTALSNISTW